MSFCKSAYSLQAYALQAFSLAGYAEPAPPAATVQFYVDRGIVAGWQFVGKIGDGTAMRAIKGFLMNGNFVAGASRDLIASVRLRSESPTERGDMIQQADVASLTLSVYVDGVVLDDFDGLTIDVADVIYDTPFGWSEDEDGANFKYTLPSEALAAAGNVRAVFTFIQAADDQPAIVVFAGPIHDPVTG